MKTTLNTTVDEHLRPIKKKFFGNTTLADRLTGRNKQDVCFKILSNPDNFDAEAVFVAKFIKVSGGKMNVRHGKYAYKRYNGGEA